MRSIPRVKRYHVGNLTILARTRFRPKPSLFSKRKGSVQDPRAIYDQKLQALDKVAEVEDHYRMMAQALELNTFAEEHFGKASGQYDPARCARPKIYLSDAHYELGNNEDALRFAKEALRLAEEAPEQRETLGYAQSVLAVYYVNNGKATEALPLLRSALDHLTHAARNSRRHLVTLSNLAATLFVMQSREEAFEFLAQAKSLCASHFGSNHRMQASIYTLSGNMNSASPEVAHSEYRLALGHWQQVETYRSNSGYGEFLASFGHLLLRLKQLEQGVEFILEADGILVTANGENYPIRYELFSYLAEAYGALKRFPKMEDAARQAMAHSEQRFMGRENAEYLRNLALLLNSLMGQEKFDEVRALVPEAERVNEAVNDDGFARFLGNLKGNLS